MAGKEYFLYTYDLTNKNASDKVRFVYVLKGRTGDKGMVDDLKGKFLAPGCFMVPVKSVNEIRLIFSEWSVKFKERRILLMD